MRILRISGGTLYGGIETLLKTYALEQSQCPELQQDFAFGYRSRIYEEIAGTASAAHWLGDVRARYPHRLWRARRRLGRLLDQGSYDAVICHAALPHAMFAPVARRRRLPLVFYLHDWADGRHWVERLARRTRPDLVLCNSAYTARSSSRLWSDVPVEVSYHPVPDRRSTLSAAQRAALRQQLDTPAEAVVVTQVARMEPYKGHLQNLEAMARLKQLPQWVLWIVGGAQRPREVEYLAQLRDRARQLGIAGRVRFAGQRGDVPAVLAASDLFSHPNLGPEPFGIAFIEALYAGLPVVSCALGGALEIVTDRCGILVPPQDIEALSAALGRLIEDPSARAALAHAGAPRAAELCDPRRRIRHEYQLLRQLVQARRA